MKIVDANVLIYAVNEASRHHEAARNWLDTALSGAEPVALPWVCLLAFIRIVTHPGIMPLPLSTSQACSIVAAWTAQPNVISREPARHHAGLLADLLKGPGSGGNLVNDAHLAALALEHGASVVTFDSDFSRFPGVRWEQPPALP